MRSVLRYLTAALALLCLAEITDLAWLSGVRATITTTASNVVAAGNGSTTQWNFSFVGVSTSDLIVSVTNSSGVTTVLTLNSQYTVTFTPQTPNSVWSVGGFVTYPLTGPPLALGNTLTIQRQVPYTQTTPFQNQGQFLPQAVETAVDLLTMQAQQLNTLFTGALVEPVTDSQPLSPLPAAAARANNALCFDATGYVPQPCATVPASSLLILGTPSIASVPIATSPTTATWIGDLNNASAFGLSTSGTASANGTALTSATTAGPAFLPTGTYATNLSELFTGSTWGPGQWTDGTNKRAPWHYSISSAPTYTGGGFGVGIATAFNGDFSHVPFPTEMWITGASTAGTPSSGYAQAPPNQIPYYTEYFTSSGHNQSTTTNDGRTGQYVYAVDAFHAGQGDAIVYGANIFVNGTSTGTGPGGILANPAGAMFGASIGTSTPGNILQVGQITLKDNGVEAAGLGWNITPNRTVASSSTGAWWNSYTSQSIGSAPVDVAYQANGQHKIVFDTSFAVLQGTVSFTGTGSGTNLTVSAVSGGYLLNNSTIAGTGVPGGTTIVSQTSGTPGGAGIYVTSGATTSSGASITANSSWTQAAFTAKANQRFYLNATATDSSGYSRFPLNAGTSYIDYNSTSAGIEAVVGGAAILTHTANGPKLTPVGFATLTACGAGLEGTFASVNDANSITWGANITAGSSTGHVLAYCDGMNWTVAGK